MNDLKAHPASPWRERLWGAAGGLLIAGAAGLAFLGAGSSAPAPASAETASTETAPPGPAATAPRPLEPAPECHLGVVLASEAVDVVTEIEGRLAEVLVRSGDAVDKGEVLAVLDTESSRRQLTVERSMIEVAQAEVRRYALQVERADQVLRRRRGLGDLVSAEEVDVARYQRDVARTAHEVAVAELGQVEARIARLESTLSRSRLRAPFAGTVALRYRDPGTAIVPGTPVVRLIGSGAPRVRFAIAPEEAKAVVPGTPVRVELAGSGAVARGTVEQRAPEIDGPSQMVFVEAGLDSAASDELGAAGAVARVTVLGAGQAPPSCLAPLVP